MDARTAGQSWLILTRRYGGDVREPSPALIAEAVSELYGDTVDLEHGSIHLRCGLADGHMVVLSADVSGRTTLEEFSDQDFGQCMSQRIMEGIGKAEAERLFQLLCEGCLTTLMSEPWINAVAR